MITLESFVCVWRNYNNRIMIMMETSLFFFNRKRVLFIYKSTKSKLATHWHSLVRFSDPDHSLNHKRERFKVFEVEPGSNHDDVIINLIIN